MSHLNQIKLPSISMQFMQGERLNNCRNCEYEFRIKRFIQIYIDDMRCFIVVLNRMNWFNRMCHVHVPPREEPNV